MFPDFLVQHRLFDQRRVLLEIVGFWTQDYLANKIARLRETGVRNLVMCIDEERVCAPADLPPEWPVVRFRRRVDAAAVLRAVEQQLQ